LYAIDPAFRRHEEDLQMLVERVLGVKPDTHFDHNFSARLRTELTAHQLEFVPSQESFLSPFYPARIIASFNVYSGLVGALVAVIIMVPLTYITTEHTVVQNNEKSKQGQID